MNEVWEFFVYGLVFDLNGGEIGWVFLCLVINNKWVDIVEILFENGVCVGNVFFVVVIVGFRECVELVFDSCFFNSFKGDIGLND